MFVACLFQISKQTQHVPFKKQCFFNIPVRNKDKNMFYESLLIYSILEISILFRLLIRLTVTRSQAMIRYSLIFFFFLKLCVLYLYLIKNNLKSILYKYSLPNALALLFLWRFYIIKLYLLLGKSHVTFFMLSHCPLLNHIYKSWMIMKTNALR